MEFGHYQTVSSQVFVMEVCHFVSVQSQCSICVVTRLTAIIMLCCMQCSRHTEDAVHDERVGDVHWWEGERSRVSTTHVRIEAIVTTLHSCLSRVQLNSSC